jgi:hypothetical protein
VKKTPRPADADAYLASLSGWQQAAVAALRAVVRENPALGEGVKWGHLVYTANGPVLLIRAEPDRVLFGFWRGQRLRSVEPRLKPGGRYDLATLQLRPDTPLSADTVRRLTAEAVALNLSLGDPTSASGLAAAGRVKAIGSTGWRSAAAAGPR